MSLPSSSDTAQPVLGVSTSLKGHTWTLRTTDDRLALAHAQRNGVPEIVGRVLAGRNIELEDADDFLNPSLKRQLSNPSLLKDLDEAVDRLVKAITEGEQIGVFGDYDVDGATSSALLKRYFDALGKPIEVYIPDRQKEGYGPNGPALRKLRDQGLHVVITVDCGAMAFEALEEADTIGLDVIVADHHQMTAQMPKTAALINPNRLDDTSGLGQLAAVGVTFFLIIGLNRKLREQGFFSDGGVKEPNLMNDLDLVALGTICDVVPLVGINRALVHQGLKVMGARRNLGISALCDIARVSEAPGTYHAGFVVGPRINAGGRVGRSDLGTRLLSSDDPSEVQGIAHELDRLNSERRNIEAEVQAGAMRQAEEQMAALDPSVLIVSAHGWHPGVIGIVASRIKDRFGRPTFVLAIEANGIAKGSGRAIPGADLGSAVTDAVDAGLLVNGGGHKMAAGLTVAEEEIEGLRDHLNSSLRAQVDLARASQGLGLDGVLSPAGATRELVEELERVAPFGAGNSEPRFALSGAEVVKADLVGENHVRCILRGAGTGSLKAIAFRAADSALGAALMSGDGRRIHLAGRLQADNWQGRKGVQFVIEDGALA